MRKILAVALALFSVYGLAQNDATCSFNQDGFSYGNKTYKLLDLIEKHNWVLGNAIMDCKQENNLLLLESHMNPQTSIYFIFNPLDETIVKVFGGTHLIYRNHDFSTIVYADGGEIYNYEEKSIKTMDLQEDEFVCALDFAQEEIEATVCSSETDTKRKL